MPDVQIYSGKKVAAPSTYELPSAAEFVLKCVNADFDGSGAAGTYLPCVTILSDSGQVIARAVDQSVSVAAGSDAEVSWFPRVRRRGAAAQVTRCTLLGSANGSGANLVVPLTTAVPGPGVLHVVFCQATIGNNTDPGAPDNVFDSQGVAGWEWTAGSEPIIGLTREQITGSGPATTSQIGSVVRPCTAGDLSAADSITVHFDTLFPALFHTAGLVIWQRCYYVTVKQFGVNTYGNGDDHPGAGASLTRLSWTDDFGAGSAQNDKDAIMLTAMGAYPAVAGFTPFEGTKIGEIASGSCSIAACCEGLIENSTPDPGGTWPSAAIQLMGNYQMVEPRTFS